MQLSSNLTLEQMLTKWSAALNPLLAVLLTQGQPLTNIVLSSGVPRTLNHSLGRTQLGFFITDQSAAASVFRTQPFNSSTLTLQSTADITINLWNF